ncbi:Chaperone protein DnaJ [Balamuthia mandrillaris]
MDKGSHQGGKPLPQATKELCYYCYDALISGLEGRNCAPPEFVDVESPVVISWARRTKDSSKHTHFEARGSLITMKPVHLHSEEFIATIRDSAFHDPVHPPITYEDISQLGVSVSLVLEDTYETIEDPTDWLVGVHGIRVTFQLKGQLCQKVYTPETIVARGWKQQEAVDACIRKAGYTGNITPEFLSGVKLTRFQTSTCTITFREYLKHVTEKEQQNKLRSAASNQSRGLTPQEEKEQTICRRRRRYIRSMSKAIQERTKQGPATSQWGTIVFILAVLGLVVAVLFLRFFEATYDRDYDAFMSNYDVLGVPPGASISTVKKAYKTLSLKWHPDKNPGCEECSAKYMRIAEAYTQITDYDKGILRLVNKPATRHEFFEEVASKQKNTNWP